MVLFSLGQEDTDWDQKGPRNSPAPAPSSLTASLTVTELPASIRLKLPETEPLSVRFSTWDMLNEQQLNK